MFNNFQWLMIDFEWLERNLKNNKKCKTSEFPGNSLLDFSFGF